MREKLLGYLMGALEDTEREQLERLLEEKPELRRQLEELSRELDFLRLAEEAEYFEPSAGLADRACRLVDACGDAPEPPRLPLGPPLHAGRGTFSAADVIVATGVCLAIALFFFPAIASSRQQAQLRMCQNNLRLIGHALQDFSQRQRGERFVPIPSSGARSIAGVYAPTLLSAGYVDDACLFFCAGRACESAERELPTLAELDTARGRLLRVLQCRAGGDYAYNLGYREGEEYRTRRNRASDTYALLADAPSLHLEDRRSANHGGCGQNVLFESGRVAYVVQCMNELNDLIFESDRGYVEAGEHVDDAVLGRSEASPFLAWRHAR